MAPEYKNVISNQSYWCDLKIKHYIMANYWFWEEKIYQMSNWAGGVTKNLITKAKDR